MTQRLLKWVGGKSKLLPELLARMPRTYNRYHEPFLGGGALFFETKPAAARLSDANEELIGCYKAVRDRPADVAAAAVAMLGRHSKEYFYETRARWNEKTRAPEHPERAAEFIYLNRTCHSGLWRVNRSGRFNTAVGARPSRAVIESVPARVAVASAALSDASLRALSFERVLEEAEAGDFVYLDPPYVPVSATANFSSYTKDAFGPAEQHRLAHVFRALDDRGCAVLLSNSDTPVVHELYAGYKIERVLCSRGMQRQSVTEVIVSAHQKETK